MVASRAVVIACVLSAAATAHGQLKPSPVPQPVPQPAAPPSCSEQPEQTQCYMEKGHALVETNPGEAAKQFLAAYRVEAKIDPLASYGLALAADGQHVAAAEALEKAVEEYDRLSAQFAAEDKNAQTTFAVLHRIKAVKDELVKLAPYVGWVQFSGGGLPAGVTAVRKGASELRSSNANRIVVKAKGDTLVFTYASGRTLEHPVSVAGGALSTIDVPPEPAETTVVDAAPPVVATDEAAVLRKRAYVAGAVGGALVVGGTVTLLATDMVPVGGGLLGLGVVGLGVAGYFYYKSETLPPKAGTEQTVLLPSVGPDGVGAALVGRF